MIAPIGRLALGTALLLAAACGRSEGSAAGGTSDMTAVDRAVAVARGIRAHPTAADSILAAHDLTRDGFDALMYDIAADSALARAYTEAVR
jgi:hypothetical protein